MPLEAPIWRTEMRRSTCGSAWIFLAFGMSALVQLFLPVAVKGSASIVVRPINPEGYLIPTTAPPDWPHPHSIFLRTDIYIDGHLIDIVAPNYYDQPISNIVPGRHHLRIEFNGMAVEKELELADGEHRTIVVEFPRAEAMLLNQLSSSSSTAIDRTYVLPAEAAGKIITWTEFYDGTVPLELHVEGARAAFPEEDAELVISNHMSYSFTGYSYNFSNYLSLQIGPHFQLGAEVESRVGSPLCSGITRPKAIAVPPASEFPAPFTYWIWQFDPSNSDYPGIELIGAESTSPRAILGTGGGHTLGAATANIRYTSARLHFGGAFCQSIEVNSADGSCCPATESSSHVVSSGLTYFKFSSVPYDMLGSGILALPNCGDTFIDEGEECDDGDQVDGDCCSSNCQLESLCGPGSPLLFADGFETGNTSRWSLATL